MNNLDNLAGYKTLDVENYLRSLSEFPEQCERCWNDWKQMSLPTGFIQAKNIIILAMGGSSIGGSIASWFTKDSNIPVTVWRGYGLPGFVGKDTLVIAVSYSGETEETLDAFKKASQKTDKLITISTGGKLTSLGTNFKATSYKIEYGSEPRAAIGYMLISILAIFNKLKIIEISDEEFNEAMVLLKGRQKKIDAGINTSYNDAKILAGKLFGKIPVFFGAGVYSEVARRFKTQINENAKSASYFEELPELNHNSMVGLEFPKDLRSKIFVVLLQSKFDHPRNKLRESITIQVLQKNRLNYDYVMIEPSSSLLSEVLQTIHFGDYVSYYLSILNNVDPTPVTIIKYLKEKLSEKPLE